MNKINQKIILKNILLHKLEDKVLLLKKVDYKLKYRYHKKNNFNNVK